MRGYKELNLRALKMLRPGGVIVTCSCSFHVSEADFAQMLSEAAQTFVGRFGCWNVEVNLRIYPVLLGVESAY